MPAVLQLQDVRFGYEPDQVVIDSLSGELAGGRLCALIGPNAAGKTTLLRLMLGQLEPGRGVLRLAGQPLGRIAPRRRAAMVSYVPRHGQVSFAFTVEQVVTMGRFALSRDDEAVEEAMAVCDLAPLRRRVFAELSAGQQQRVLLARAIAQARGDGCAILLDEPVSSMDLRHVHQTMQTLVRLARSGLAVVVVLHDLNLAGRYADDVWLLHRGRLAASGPWRQVLTAQRLGSVYGVQVHRLDQSPAGRPMFCVEVDATLKTARDAEPHRTATP